MTTRYRPNYTLVPVLEQLGVHEEGLDVPWAEFTGDRSSKLEFTVSTADAVDPYIELQIYEVGAFGHEILINDEPLSGFDVPPGDGWQYWMDNVTNVDLQEGTNTIQLHRDTSTNDSFAVGNVIVNWREPVDEA